MLKLLENLATILIRKYKPVIICVTGSVGKTSTKNAIASTLSECFSVRKTPKNINGNFGVPISIIGGFQFKEGFLPILRILFYGLIQLMTNNFPEVLVIEVGAGNIGEIERISKWLKPDFLVITNLPDKPSHLGIFGSKEKIIKEKRFLVEAMGDDGILLIDETEKNMSYFIDKFNGTTIYYNSKEILDDANYKIIYQQKTQIINPVGIKFELCIYNERHKLKFRNFIGKQNIKSIIVAKLIAEKLNCNKDNILPGLLKYNPEPGRLRILAGKLNNVVIIDDSFNSSPIAVENSLYNLTNLKVCAEQRKIAVLGDMLNLGDKLYDIHKNTAVQYMDDIDILITVGKYSEIWQSFNRNKFKLNRHFKNSMQVAKYISSIWEVGDIILFKGGHLIRLEKAVKHLSICTQEELVRQEKYWQKSEFELYN